MKRDYRFIGLRAVSGCLLVLGGLSCGSAESTTPAPQPAAQPPPVAASPAAVAEQPAPEPEPLPQARVSTRKYSSLTAVLAPTPQPPDPKVAACMKRLIDRGIRLYGRGEYDKAEVILKDAVMQYPFVPEANLILGKIFLIRGSATRDVAMINSARLMFEMARALDPDMREPAVLLDLFLATPPD